MKGVLRLGARNLRRNRRRVLITGLSIAVGFAGLLFTFGYILRIEQYLRLTQIHHLRTGHLVVYKPGALEKFVLDPEAYGFSPAEQDIVRRALNAEQNVARVHPVLVTSGLAGNGCKSVPFRAVGVQLEDERWTLSLPELRRHTPELIAAITGRRLIFAGDVEGAVEISDGLANLLQKPQSARPGAALPETVLELNCEAPDSRQQIGSDPYLQLLSGTFSGGVAAADVAIVGQINPGFTEFQDNGLVLPLDQLQTFHDTQVVTYFAVFLHDTRQIETKGREMADRIQKAGLRAQVYPWNDMATSPQYVSVKQMLSLLGSVIFMIMSAVVGLSIVNSVTITLIERKRELGTLRALGFTPRQIMRVLMLEVFVLTAASGVVGLGGGMAATWIVNGLNIRFKPPGIAGTMQFMVRAEPFLYVAIALLVSLIALVSTYFAARRVLRRSIVELLAAA